MQVKTATPSTSEKKETTPLKKEATPVKTPAGEPTTPEEKVVKLEAEIARLTSDSEKAAARQATADKVADAAKRQARIEKIEKKKVEVQLKRIREGEDYIPPEEPEGETQVEREVRLEAKIGIQNLILDNPDYQELLKEDITLKQVLRNNPFALIGEYFDSQDAVDQIKEKLDDRVSSLKIEEEKKQSEEDTKEGKKGGKEFEVGTTQPGKETPKAPAEELTPTVPMDKVEESIRKKIKVT